jgi:hypothetical protein
MLLLIFMSGGICWRVSPSTPLSVVLPSNQRLEILNPVFTRHFEQSRFLKGGVSSGRSGLELYSDEEVIFTTHAIGVNLHGAIDLKEESQALMSFIPLLMSACRLVSKQAGLSKNVNGIINLFLNELPKLVFPEPDPNVEGIYRSYIKTTGLTLEHIYEADQLLLKGDIPAYHEIMLDAIEAFYVSDYRKAILYAAIAMESLASEVLENAYSRLLFQAEPINQWRIIELTLEGGKKKREDPIYEYLKSRDNFRALLHERPLYLFQKSLLMEDKNLYDTAIDTYDTRNKIVHKASNGRIPINYEGAVRALRCAVAIFRWFGEDSAYVIPPGRGLESKGVRFHPL